MLHLTYKLSLSPLYSFIYLFTLPRSTSRLYNECNINRKKLIAGIAIDNIININTTKAPGGWAGEGVSGWVKCSNNNNLILTTAAIVDIIIPGLPQCKLQCAPCSLHVSLSLSAPLSLKAFYSPRTICATCLTRNPKNSTFGQITIMQERQVIIILCKCR